VTVLALLVAWLAARSILHSINWLDRRIRELGSSDIAAELPEAKGRDEIAQIARAVGFFRDAIASKLNAASGAQIETAARAAAERKHAMESLAVAFERTVGEIVHRVTDIAHEMEGSAANMTRTAESTQTLSTALAAASSQSSANVQSVAAATEELATSIGEIDRQLKQSRDIAADAVAQAKTADQRISELSKSGARIGDVVNLITAIAATIDQQGAATRDIARHVNEAATGTGRVAHDIGNVSSGANETGAASAQVLSSAQALASESRRLKAAMDEFLGTVRAA
jgi:methyl-accepting chemotaxis protein